MVARLEDLEGIAHKNVAGKQITEPPVMNTPAKELDKDLVRFNTILTWSFQNFLDATEALVNPREEPPEVLPEVPPKPLYEVPPEVLEILNNMVWFFPFTLMVRSEGVRFWTLRKCWISFVITCSRWQNTRNRIRTH